MGSSPHNSVKATDAKRPVAQIPVISTAVMDPNTSHSVTRPFAMIHCLGLRDSKIFPCPLMSSFDSHCPPWTWTCHLTCSQLRGAYLRGQLQDCIQDFCIATVCGLTIQSTQAKMSKKRKNPLEVVRNKQLVTICYQFHILLINTVRRINPSCMRTVLSVLVGINMCRLFPLESKELALSLGDRQKKNIEVPSNSPNRKIKKDPQVGSSS